MQNISIKATETNGITTIKMLIRHPMETGQRKDENGNFIAVNFINKVEIINDKDISMIAVVNWGPSIAKDPNLFIKTTAIKKGGYFTIKWFTYSGQEYKQTAIVE